MTQSMTLEALPAFTDNYIWLLHRDGQAVVIDPGQADVVESALSKQGLKLEAILVTHHHGDHTGGVDELHQRHGATVYASAKENMATPHTSLQQGDRLNLLGGDWHVLDVPGHTSGHVAFVCHAPDQAPLLFCGDTLFSAGCGRLFEGTPAQMLRSLDALSALPNDTRVCCAHEYTLSNLRFALAVDPHNRDLQAYALRCRALRDQDQPTLPAHLATERQINPFLRVRDPAVQKAVVRQAGLSPAEEVNEVAVFAALREWKNNF